MTDIPPLAEAALVIAQLAQALGEAPINRLLGLWRCQVDQHWLILANGQKFPVQEPPLTTPLAPFNFMVFYDDLPAGSFDSFGGGFAADMESEFIAAMKARIAAEDGTDGPHD